jgi:outer membrane beta-barrel protein
MNRKLWILLVASAAATGVTTPVSAQEATTDEGASTPTAESDMDTFWSDRRNPRVLQRRMYEKDGEFQLTLFAGAIPNDPFNKYWPLGLRAGYWLSENIGLELSGSYVGLSGDTDLSSFLSERGEVDVFLRDEQIWRADLGINWAPIYGKFSFSGTKLAHFDWFFGAGLGVVSVNNPIVEEGFVEETQIKPEAVLNTGWNLHLHQRWALRVDYHQFIFQKDSGGVTMPSEVSLGGSFFF